MARRAAEGIRAARCGRQLSHSTSRATTQGLADTRECDAYARCADLGSGPVR
jgi:hypothetical protein